MVQVIRPLDLHAQLDAALAQRSVSRFGNIPALEADQSQVLPPAYPAASSAPNQTCAPAYTAQASPTERVISRTDSRIVQTASGSRVDGRPLPEAYITKSSKLVLDLGRRVWTSRIPVYGANALVSGKVLVKKSDHALNICVTVSSNRYTSSRN
jgi:hypothetical protein